MMRAALGPRQWRRSPLPFPLPLTTSSKKKLRLLRVPSKSLLVRLLVILALIASVPPVFFHFRLRRFHQMRMRRCGWLKSPPLVCAHGGDSSRAVPNTMTAYRIAIQSHVDCIEIDVSRSFDGTLFALHDRDLQRMSGNNTAKVGFMSSMEINKLEAGFTLGSHGHKVPTIHEALTFMSGSVRQVVLDVKVGPPFYEKDLAKDVLSVVQSSDCKNCFVWAKNDAVVHDLMKLKGDARVGYIVMKDPITGAMSNLNRIKNAGVVGIYHPLIDKRLVQIIHRNDRQLNGSARTSVLFNLRITNDTPSLFLLQAATTWGEPRPRGAPPDLSIQPFDAQTTEPTDLRVLREETETQLTAAPSFPHDPPSAIDIFTEASLLGIGH